MPRFGLLAKLTALCACVQKASERVRGLARVAAQIPSEILSFIFQYALFEGINVQRRGKNRTCGFNRLERKVQVGDLTTK